MSTVAAGGRRGPFTLWGNPGGEHGGMDVVTDPLRAFDFRNAMLRIDAIDSAG